MKRTKAHQESDTRMAELALAILRLDEYKSATVEERRIVLAKELYFGMERTHNPAERPTNDTKN